MWITIFFVKFFSLSFLIKKYFSRKKNFEHYHIDQKFTLVNFWSKLYIQKSVIKKSPLDFARGDFLYRSHAGAGS